MTEPFSALIRRSRPAVRRCLGGADDDTGLTLLEVVMSMSITAVITAIFTGGLVQSYQMTNATASAADAQANMHGAFSRLDKQVRYASVISRPGNTAAAEYVEFVTPANGVAVCTQLRITASPRTLQSRIWRAGGAPSGWTTLASNVAEPAGFTRLLATTDGAGRQQLTVTLSVSVGKGRTAVTESSSVTFTAMNTSIDTNKDDRTCDTNGRP